MKKNYLLCLALLLQISYFTAQTKLVYWYGTNTSTASYPRSGSGLTSELTTAVENYNGLNTYADNRNVWNNTDASSTVDPATSPYLSYTLSTNSTIQFDRFVLGGASVTGGAVKLQLRWSVDSYANSLGDFSPLDGSYHLFSVDLSSQSGVPSGSIEFRVYAYNAAGNFFNPGYYSYTSLDGTPASYGGGSGQAISIWADQSLSADFIQENKISVKVYPNPSSDYVKVYGLKGPEKYVISNVLGAKIIEGTVSNNQEIKIKKLLKGLYVLSFENGITLKFIKE